MQLKSINLYKGQDRIKWLILLTGDQPQFKLLSLKKAPMLKPLIRLVG